VSKLYRNDEAQIQTDYNKMFDEWTIPTLALKAFEGVVKANALAMLILPLASVYQERKIWVAPMVPQLTLWGYLKVYIFNVGWFTLTATGAIVLLPLYLLGFRDFVSQQASVTVERYTGYILMHTFIGPVEVRGEDNLPPRNDSNSNPSCVFISNHSSQIDAGAILFTSRRWKWIVKRSILYLPGVGWVMALGRHISIQRSKDRSKSRESVQYMYKAANKTLQDGNSMFVFPQGTRRMTERLPFKDGAFNIAIEAEAPLVPISIQIPLTAWNSLYPFNLLWKKKKDMEPVVLTVHKQIQVKKDSDKEKIKEEAFNVIYSVLPDYRKKN
jgi:1-acyl-sn-glycerol-3-phosphate acyltransferase